MHKALEKMMLGRCPNNTLLLMKREDYERCALLFRDTTNLFVHCGVGRPHKELMNRDEVVPSPVILQGCNDLICLWVTEVSRQSLA